MVSSEGNTLRAEVITFPKIDNLRRPANDESEYNFLYFVLQSNTFAGGWHMYIWKQLMQQRHVSWIGVVKNISNDISNSNPAWHNLIPKNACGQKTYLDCHQNKLSVTHCKALQDWNDSKWDCEKKTQKRCKSFFELMNFNHVIIVKQFRRLRV